MIYLFLTSLGGFAALSFITYIHWRHARELEILMKSKTLGEARAYGKEPEQFQIQDELSPSEAIVGKSPDQIREMFKTDRVG